MVLEIKIKREWGEVMQMHPMGWATKWIDSYAMWGPKPSTAMWDLIQLLIFILI